LFGCNGILFNHESPIRGEDFVTRKITKGVADICANTRDWIELGNLDVFRDWGHAKDYVKAMYLMLQREDGPSDYVVATGIQTSVRTFCEKAFKAAGLDLNWRGRGVDEVGYCYRLGKEVIKINPAYYRPAEVHTLLGDSRQAQKLLDWIPKISLDELIFEMVNHDLKQINV
jgi:GDPmannose 4,6-dehydratase